MSKAKLKRPHAITFSQPTLTQQHSKDEVDINKIMARYIRTGVLDHVAKYQPQYLDNTAIDYHQSQNIIANADEMFLELPSSVRETFSNDPAQFLDFVHNPDNHSKLAAMGLTETPISPPGDIPAANPSPVQPAVTPTPQTPSAPAAPDTSTPTAT